jgi:hypothetical protein
MNVDENKLGLLYESSMAQQHALMQEIKRRLKAKESPLTSDERSAILNKEEIEEESTVDWFLEGVIGLNYNSVRAGRYHGLIDNTIMFVFKLPGYTTTAVSDIMEVKILPHLISETSRFLARNVEQFENIIDLRRNIHYFKHPTDIISLNLGVVKNSIGHYLPLEPDSPWSDAKYHQYGLEMFWDMKSSAQDNPEVEVSVRGSFAKKTDPHRLKAHQETMDRLRKGYGALEPYKPVVQIKLLSQ